MAGKYQLELGYTFAKEITWNQLEDLVGGLEEGPFLLGDDTIEYSNDDHCDTFETNEGFDGYTEMPFLSLGVLESGTVQEQTQEPDWGRKMRLEARRHLKLEMVWTIIRTWR